MIGPRNLLQRRSDGRAEAVVRGPRGAERGRVASTRYFVVVHISPYREGEP